jgi:hypothetical protein
MENKNKIRIEKNDATTSHNGNILVEVESSDLTTEELKDLALEIVNEIRKKRKL